MTNRALEKCYFRSIHSIFGQWTLQCLTVKQCPTLYNIDASTACSTVRPYNYQRIIMNDTKGKKVAGKLPVVHTGIFFFERQGLSQDF